MLDKGMSSGAPPRITTHLIYFLRLNDKDVQTSLKAIIHVDVYLSLGCLDIKELPIPKVSFNSVGILSTLIPSKY